MATNTHFRQGDAAGEPRDRDWDPQTDAKATTLSRNASGRGSIRKPALTKAALMRLAAGEKKAEEEEKKRQKSEFGREGSSFDLLRNRSVTPSNSLMTRSAYVPSSNFSDYNSRSENSRSKSKTPQLSRRSSSRCGSIKIKKGKVLRREFCSGQLMGGSRPPHTAGRASSR